MWRNISLETSQKAENRPLDYEFTLRSKDSESEEEIDENLSKPIISRVKTEKTRKRRKSGKLFRLTEKTSLPDISSLEASSPDAQQTEIVPENVLPRLKRGTTLLKYARFGPPHFRLFRVSSDAKRLIWYSKSKWTFESSLPFSQVETVIAGQKTAPFKRYAAPNVENLSFSLIYENGERSLNLIAKTLEEYKTWYGGICALVSESHREDIEEITVPLAPIIKAKILDMEYEELNADAMKGVKLNPKALWKSFMKQKAKCAKLRRKYEEKGVIWTEFLRWHVEHIEVMLAECKEWYEFGDYARCDELLWKISVEIGSIEQVRT